MISVQNNIEQFLFTPGKFFLIPDFQRPYSWQAENIKSFLEDLEACVGIDKNHFFGSVVYVNEGNASSIIDGQQRVTTVLLMLTAIFHLVESNSSLSKIPAEAIKEKYLYNKYEYTGEENRIKLKTVTTDNVIFEKIFNNDELTASEKQSKLYLAYQEFKSYFAKRQNLDSYIEALTHFEIVTIALDARDDNPQRVFESINSTGKPLTDGDKIRNFALMLNHDKMRKYVLTKYWANIEKSLTDVNKDFITDFFRSYIISKRQAVITVNSVYPEFKKLFSKQVSEEQDEESIDRFYGDIVQMLEYYKLCKFGVDDKTKFAPITDTTFKMRYIQTELYIPFAITVMRHFDEGKISAKQLTEVFNLIESYFSRRIVCNIPTTSVDKFLASLHKDVLEHLSDHTDADYVEVMKYIVLGRTGLTRMPSQTEFVSAIKNNQTYNQRTAHVNYILTAVDDLSKESATLRQIANHELKLSIEHIMPQTLNKTWREELGDNASQIHDEYVHKLANLTLTGYNSEYSNRPFNEKKTMPNGFEDSKLAINKHLGKIYTWNESELKKREKWWIENLEKVWPMPSTTFQPPVVDTTISLLDDLDLTGTAPRMLHFMGDSTPVTSWAQVIDVIVERLYDSFDNFIVKVQEDESIARFISPDASSFGSSAEIHETGYYVDTGINTNRKQKLIQAMAHLFDLGKNDVLIELSEPLDDPETAGDRQ
jgi:uncharacterized protein with ParB-like and HNH nuclease domain